MLAGRMGAAEAADLRATISAAAVGGSIRVDVGGVERWDGVALNALLEARRALLARGFRVAVVDLRWSQVYDLMIACDLRQLAALVENVRELRGERRPMPRRSPHPARRSQDHTPVENAERFVEGG